MRARAGVPLSLSHLLKTPNPDLIDLIGSLALNSS
jgi:hypothetical protein